MGVGSVGFTIVVGVSIFAISVLVLLVIVLSAGARGLGVYSPELLLGRNGGRSGFLNASTATWDSKFQRFGNLRDYKCHYYCHRYGSQ